MDRIATSTRAALRCHELRRQGVEDPRRLLRLAGGGDRGAERLLGFGLTAEAAAAALAAVEADLALLALEEDPELAGPPAGPGGAGLGVRGLMAMGA